MRAAQPARKTRLANCLNTLTPSNRLAVPDRLSFVHGMRYNQRAVKKSSLFPRLDLKPAVPSEMGLDADEGSGSGTSG
jgi:hypothetical protein